ncbi:hypothetical protein OHR68_35310 [Spirillospora sp. NBC_00431]
MTINRRAIERMAKDIQREFDKHPIKVPVQANNHLTNSELPDPHTAIGLRCVQVLDWLDQRSPRASQVRDFLPTVGIDGTVSQNEAPPWLRQVVSILRNTGLVNVSATLSGYLDYSLWLTDQGIRNAAERAARRRSSPRRRAACRRGILLWLDECTDANSPQLERILTTPWGTFEGDLFSVEEISQACQHLAGRGLITERPLGLTSNGIDCVENFDASVADYLATRKGAPVTINNFNNISGGLFAIGNRDVQQHQTNGVAAADVIAFATALRSVIPDLDDERASAVSAVADQIEEEANRDDPDQTWLLRLAERGRRLLQGAEGIAAVAGVVEQGNQVINTLGG